MEAELHDLKNKVRKKKKCMPGFKKSWMCQKIPIYSHYFSPRTPRVL